MSDDFDPAEAAAIDAQAIEFAAERDELRATIAERDRQIAKLRLECASWSVCVDEFKARIVELEAKGAAGQKPVAWRELLEAADYLIGRLRDVWLGKPVRDLDEAEERYLRARVEQGGGK